LNTLLPRNHQSQPPRQNKSHLAGISTEFPQPIQCHEKIMKAFIALALSIAMSGGIVYYVHYKDNSDREVRSTIAAVHFVIS